MSDSESLDYLQDGFDPHGLTVPRLRSILVTYNVQYPGTAKKQQLVDLFNDNVAPQAKKILAQRARAKRSSMGIVDAYPSQSQSTSGMDGYDLMPPPASSRTTRARSPRKTRVKQESEEPSEYETELRSPRKRQSRSASRQLPTASDTDTGTDGDASRSVRRARTKTPQIKLEAPEEEEMPRPSSREESVFTNDNPFQSGSSPPPPAKTPSSRRKTTGMDAPKSRTPSAGRRRTDGPVHTDEAADTAFRRSFEIPLSQLNGPRTPPQPTLDAGEEFTPEEQLELTQAEAARPSRAVAPRRRNTARKGMSLSTPLWVLVATLLSAYAAWYRQEKIAVGYCGVGRPARSIIPSNIELPEWAQRIEIPDWARSIEAPAWTNALLEPQCEPCPPHAFCYEDFSVRCENDYILKPHPLSLGGAIPLPPTCEPDGEKVRRVKVVADKAVEELRDRRAKWECGDLVDEEGHTPDTPAIEEQVLKEVISEKRSRKLNKEEFDDLWVSALGEITARDEVEVEVQQYVPRFPFVSRDGSSGGSNSSNSSLPLEVQNTFKSVSDPATNQLPRWPSRTTDPGAIPNTYLSSTSLARLPLTCALRRSVRLGLARYRLHLSAVVLSILAVLYGRSRYRSHVATSAQIPALVDIVLERLATQKELSYEDDVEDPFLFLPNLRDDVLRATHSLSERERVWQRVRAVVEQNSNVRTGQREGHNGEVGRAWEWIGTSGGGADGSARRRRSGRVSWGPDVKTIDQGSDNAKATPEMTEKVDRSAFHRRWEESRPIY